VKLADLPQGMIDWSLLPPTVQAGATGSAAARARSLGEIQLRLVEYRAGYVADHWCRKGHILFVIAGALVIEHQDGSRYDLAGGTTWHVADDAAAAHRVVCERGATVFIVD
jgi:formylmethanofuran:tetrahydromethanopterin formyltransferase